MKEFMSKNKLFLMFSLMMTLFAVSASAAGAGDALGLASTWTKVQTWFSDPAVTSIVGILVLLFAIILFFQKMYIFGLIVIILLVVLMNITTVASTFAGASILLM